MKKLCILLSAVLLSAILLYGCGSGGGSQPSTPKLTAATSTNVDGSTSVSWSSNDASITSVEVQDASNSDVLYEGGPTGTTTVDASVSSVNLVARNSIRAVVAELFITFGIIPGPPPPPPIDGYVPVTVSWTLPTTYSDGTFISSDNQAKMIVQVWWKETNEVFTESDTLLATSQPGATSVYIPSLYVIFNKAYYFSLRCQIPDDGNWSAFAPPYYHSWPTP